MSKLKELLHNSRENLKITKEGFKATEKISQHNLKVSEQTAQTSQQNLKISEQTAQTSQQNLKISEQTAQTSQQNLKISEQTAQTSQQNLKISELALENSQKALKIAQEIQWGLIFRDTIADSPWLKKKNFSASGWAANYSMLYIIYRILDNISPKNILELGLGESTKLSSQYIQNNQDSNLTIIEQDENWVDYYSKNVFDIKNNALIFAREEIIIDEEPSGIYEGLSEALQNQKFDLIVIDGPIGSPRNSRSQMLDIVKNNIDPKNFIILLHDSNRIGEQDTIKKTRDYLLEQEIAFSSHTYRSEKDLILIFSENYSFIKF